MQMKTTWKIATPYDGTKMDHWQSQSFFYKAAWDLGIKKLKWASGQSIPANWLGYNEENPSPGHRIDLHYWFIDDEMDAMTFHLAFGTQIKQVEIEAK